MAEVELVGELVVVGDQCFAHAEFLNLFHDEIMARFEELVPRGACGADVHRALAQLRTPAAHKAILTKALARLVAEGTPAPRGCGQVVAAFPLP